jgi:polyhydroxyalkanoate synthesis repressor PhaR
MGRTASTPGLIKRYDNRKLYDPAGRRHVTLDDLARRIAAGEELKIVEQKTGEDITTQLLAQMVLELIRQRTSRVPQEVLARLVRFSVGPEPIVEPEPRQDAASKASDEAERIVGELVKRGRLTLEEALSLRQELGHSLLRLLTDTQKRLEGHVHGLMELTERESGLSPALASLRKRLLALETHIPLPGTGPRPTKPQRARAGGTATRKRTRKGGKPRGRASAKVPGSRGKAKKEN